MHVADQPTQPLTTRHAQTLPLSLDYRRLKRLANLTGVRLLSVYRLSQGLPVREVDETRARQMLYYVMQGETARG